MKLIGWNVNSLRSCMTKGFKEFMLEEDPDFILIEETKMQEGQADISLDGYKYIMNSAVRKGYSGTLIYYKKEPLSYHLGLIDGKHNEEGRVLTLEYENYYLVVCYSPNSKEGLLRLDYRMEFEDALKEYLLSLQKPVIFTGDLNVSHQEIDIKNPKQNERNAGFTIEERTKFSSLLESGFIDTFRYLHPDLVKYSWWSYRFKAREKNIGWRLDYFLVSNELKDKILKADIYTEVLGSDHAPILLEIDL